jgi:hypothetical protein
MGCGYWLRTGTADRNLFTDANGDKIHHERIVAEFRQINA